MDTVILHANITSITNLYLVLWVGICIYNNDSFRTNHAMPGARMPLPILMRQLVRLGFALSFAAITSGWNPSPFAQEQEQVVLSQFDRLTASSGWILLDRHLFWTSDAGQSWEEMTPSMPANADIQDIHFIDTSTGWVLWTTMDLNGSASFSIAHTIDRGNTWTSRPLSPRQVRSVLVEKAEISWFDMQGLISSSK
jgi:hypothetical protein